MSRVSRSRVSLRLIGDELDPAEVTNLLGCAPTFSCRKGDVHLLRDGLERIEKSGVWVYETREGVGDVDRQAMELFDRLTSDAEVWSELSEKYYMELLCGLFMEASNEAVSISPMVLRSLSERGIELVMDIYDGS